MAIAVTVKESLIMALDKIRDVSNIGNDPRVRSIIITKIEEALLWETRLANTDDEVEW